MKTSYTVPKHPSSRFRRQPASGLLPAVILALSALAGCSGDNSSSNSPGVEPGVSLSVSVNADPLTLKTSETSTVTVRVTDANGTPAPDGTAVALSVDPLLGTLANATHATVAGEAKTLFTAGATAGQTVITAMSGGAQDSISLTVEARLPATLRIVVAKDNKPDASSGIHGNVTGYVQAAEGGPTIWIQPTGPGEQYDLLLPESGKRYRWLFKICGGSDYSLSTTGAAPLYEWGGETELHGGVVTTIQINTNNTSRKTTMKDCAPW